MNTTDDPARDDRDDDLRAAEYVLGTLDASERAAFVERLARDPLLARAIEAWRGRLSPMVDEIPPVVPPMHLWHRVRARAGIELDGDSRASTTRARLWDRLAFWRGVGLAGIAATAACLAVFLTIPRLGAPTRVPASALPHPVHLVATMADGKGRTTFFAAVDDDACTLVLMPLERKPAPGRVPQLWVLGADGVPRSLGVGGSAPVQPMVVPASLRAALLRGALQSTASLAVSLEPPGGSRTGRPSGFIAGTGALTRL